MIPSLAHISIILVEPQSPGNIGMVCRAMANFGCKDLRLVNPCQHLHAEARKFAVAANHLLGEARLFPNLAAAVSDLTLSVATTRRSGRLRGELLDITEVPALQENLPQQGRFGLVFGREDSGLTSEEVSLCSHAATIETSATLGSLNLAQAVILFLYEMARTPKPTSSTATSPHPSQGDLEELFGQIETILTRTAFLNPSRPEAVMHRIRQLAHRAGLSVDDHALLRGICSQLSWSLRDWRGRKRGSN